MTGISIIPIFIIMTLPGFRRFLYLQTAAEEILLFRRWKKESRNRVKGFYYKDDSGFGLSGRSRKKRHLSPAACISGLLAEKERSLQCLTIFDILPDLLKKQVYP
jgi:hypothetical protein